MYYSAVAHCSGEPPRVNSNLPFANCGSTTCHAELVSASPDCNEETAGQVRYDRNNTRSVNEATTIRNKYITEAQNYVRNKDTKGLLALLQQAVEDFNGILDLSKTPPKIGIVGEIYVKYNDVGHKGVVNWLVEQGAEVVMPSLLSFFVQYFVNRKADVDLYLEERNVFNEVVPFLLQKQLKRVMKKVTKVAGNYKLWTDFGDINEDALEASEIISLATQFGEGWLIPAEIGNFNKHNVQNVVSLQPFGCIANHIISKGIEKKIKEHYPKMNLLFLDFDSGVSDVNVHNRLHFMLKNARNVRE
jgi:predicted nucleotide-binding protein (sugar kinase/HSP70/actin superfamily)